MNSARFIGGICVLILYCLPLMAQEVTGPAAGSSVELTAPDDTVTMEGSTAPATKPEKPWWKIWEREKKPAQPDTPRIKKVKIEGCDQLACSTVKSILRQRKTPWYKIKPGDDGYDEFWAEDDRRRIELFYKSKGYFQVEVAEPVVVKDKRGKSVSITYHVKEGRPTIVTRIEIIFEDGITDDHHPMTMRELLEFKEGGHFELEPYQRSARAMENFFKDLGYYRATASRSALIDPERLTARVSYQIVRGIRYRIGEIKIEGCEKTSTRVVERTMSVKTGDRYSRSKLIEDQRRVQRLPIYRTVRVIESPDDENRVVNLTYRIEEGEPREVKVGVGYGTEEEWRVMGSWRHVNFLGGARELQVTARWSMLLEQEEIKFIQPNIGRSGDFISFALTRTVQNEEAFSHEAIAFSPTYHFILTTYLFAEVSYRIETNRTYNVINRLELRQEDLAKEGLLSAISGRLEWAEVDDKINPTRGARAGLYVEYGGGPVGGDFPYYKVTGEARGYYPIYPPVIGAIRWKLGYAEPLGELTNLPLFLRFFTGGTGMVRGFGRYDLGPQDQDNNPIGGVKLYETSLEFRFPIWDALGGVVFTDGGWVWPERADIDFDDVRYAGGFGIRYQTPIGPLALDVGFPLDQTGSRLNYQIHFNVGQAF